MEHVEFVVVKLSLPYNAILGRPFLYAFMAVVHYGYLCMKMLGPNGVITIPRDRPATASAMEKLQALAAQGYDEPRNQGSPSSIPGVPTISQGPLDAPVTPEPVPGVTPHQMGLLSGDTSLAKVIQIGAEASQTARIGGGLGAE